MSTKWLRKWFGLTQQELSEYFGIPLRTITNWDNRECMPSYVYNMMRTILWDCFFRLQNFSSERIEISENGFDQKYSLMYRDILKKSLR